MHRCVSTRKCRLGRVRKECKALARCVTAFTRARRSHVYMECWKPTRAITSTIQWYRYDHRYL